MQHIPSQAGVKLHFAPESASTDERANQGGARSHVSHLALSYNSSFFCYIDSKFFKNFWDVPETISNSEFRFGTDQV